MTPRNWLSSSPSRNKRWFAVAPLRRVRSLVRWLPPREAPRAGLAWLAFEPRVSERAIRGRWCDNEA